MTSGFRERFRRFLAARLDPKSELGLRLTINVAVFALAIWAFGGLLDGVLDNEWLVRADLAINGWFHGHATPGGRATFDVITNFGTVGVGVAVVVVTLWLWLRNARFLAVAWLATNAGGAVVMWVLKTSVHRTRPQYAAEYLHGHSYSFPSAHTMFSTICYTLLAFVIGTLAHWPARRRALLYVASTTLVLLIAFSRMYLGVHYPSDVLGGLAAGTAWLAACVGALNVVRDRWLAPVAAPGSNTRIAAPGSNSGIDAPGSNSGRGHGGKI
jgi:undecaprenyl-diphosphatase